MSPSNDEDVRARWKESGWKQGSLMRTTDLQASDVTWWPHTPTPNSDDRVVVLTQTCDLMHVSSEKEPVAELLLLRPVHKKRESFRRARHPRILQLNDDQTPTFEWEGVITHRAWMPKEALLKISPCGAVADADLDSLVTWIANRYVRAALPDQFWERLRHGKNRKAYEDALDACADDVSDVLVGLMEENQELDPGQPYHVELIVAVPPAVAANATALQRVKEHVYAPLAALFSQSGAFELGEDSCVMGTDTLTVALAQELIRLDSSFTPE
jgi:hypothetical protein